MQTHNGAGANIWAVLLLDGFETEGQLGVRGVTAGEQASSTAPAPIRLEQEVAVEPHAVGVTEVKLSGTFIDLTAVVQVGADDDVIEAVRVDISGAIHGDLQGTRHAQARELRQDLAQILAAQQLHDEERLAPGVARIINGGNVFAREQTNHHRLTHETVNEPGLTHKGAVQDFHCNRLLADQVHGLEGAGT